MARDEERQEPDSEPPESQSPPPEHEGEAEAWPTQADPSGDDPVTSETPPEHGDAHPDEAASSEASASDEPGDAAPGEPASGDAADAPPQKVKTPGTGKLWFVLLLIVGAAGFFGWKGFEMLRGHEGDLLSLNQKSDQLGADIQKLRELTHQLSEKNAAQLEQLIARFEASQLRISKNTEEQRRTLESLQEEIEKLKEGVRIGTIQLQSTEEVSGSGEELAPVSEEVMQTPETPPTEMTEEAAPEETPENEAGTEESTPPETIGEDLGTDSETAAGPVEPNEVTPGAPEEMETAVEESAEENADAESVEDPEVTGQSVPQEETVAEIAPEEEMTTESAETGDATPSAEPQPEPTPAVETAEAPPQPETSKPPQETQSPKTPRGPQRSEEAQSYIDFVESSGSKAWSWVKEGSKKLWGSLKDLF